LTPAKGERPLPDTDTAVSADELRAFSEAMGALREGPRALAAEAAGFIRLALRASGVRLEFGAHHATAGDPPSQPVLVEAITIGDKARGNILVGSRPKVPYGRSDVEKLSLYASMIGRLFEAAQDRQRWQRLALTDDLSDLRNRRYLLQALSHLLRRAEAERFRLTLLILDIDDFKHYNDQFGHPVGDELIREIAKLLKECCRRHDIVTRLGGDEFAVVFWDAEEPREAGSQHPSNVLAILERVRNVLRHRDWHTLGPDARGRLTISGGLATFPWDARTPEDLLEEADKALLNAKRLGKDRIYLVGGESLPLSTE
jgi:diguanylate cyclase (GGDEF)-like protein